MNRIVRIDPELLEWGAKLAPEDRLRQALAAFRLYHALHDPFREPFHRGFDTYEEFNAFDEEASRGR